MASDRPLNQVAQPDRPVQKAVLTVQMQMYETGLCH
jgi:hypothetical protein